MALPLLNEWQRLHWAARRRYMMNLAWHVRAKVPNSPFFPLEACRIHVNRYTNFQTPPDQDGLLCKPLFDVLVRVSKRNPHGLGIIDDDGPGCILHQEIHAIRCKPNEVRTEVFINEVDE